MLTQAILEMGLMWLSLGFEKGAGKSMLKVAQKML